LTNRSCKRVETIRVLGLDPGSRITGWGVLEGTPRSAAAQGFGCLRPARGLSRARTLAALGRGLEDLLARLQPAVVVVETPFVARYLKAALALAEARGALLAVLGHWGGDVVEYEPATVKSAIVGYGRAEKRQVAYIVQQLLGLSSAPPADAADALALALCHLRKGCIDA
jgi:crossover junction endodeoxyribonuclease RuvC